MKYTKAKTRSELIYEIKTTALGSSLNIDSSLIRAWIEENDEIISYRMNEDNVCVFVKIKSVINKSNYYRFFRFFNIGGITQVSIDYDSNRGYEPVSIEEKLGELLNEKYGK